MSIEKANELQEILEGIQSLMDDAEYLLQGTQAESRAKAYWVAHIRMAMDDEHQYLGGSMCNIQATINELREEEDGDEDEGE